MRVVSAAAALLLAAAPALAQDQAASDKPAAAAEAGSPADRAAAAAQRAAEAAEKAAEAAARSAAAIEKLAPGAAAPAAPGAPAAAPAAKPPPAWTGLVSLGLIALTGNAQALTFKLTSAFERKSDEWIWGVKANAVYGQARIAGQSDDQVNALGAALQVRGDRRFTEALSAYLLAGVETDHVKSIEERPFGELGVSVMWWDVKEKDGFQKSSLRTDLGFRYGHEYRFQYYPAAEALPGVDIIAPHAGANLRYAVNKDVIFTQDVDAVGNLVGDARLLLTLTSKLNARLTAATSLGIAFAIAYDSVPPPTKLGTDTALTVSLDVAL